MLVIILYWVYLFFITSAYGIFVQKACSISRCNPIFIPFLGAFGISLLSGAAAIWFPLNWNFELALFVGAILSSIIFRNRFREYLFSLKAKITALSKLLKVLFFTMSVFALAQSASAPYIIDNESYYIQTIKWLDTYGFVNGLANFHFFLGQQSGWHIFQSATNLNDVLANINDVNGLFLILVNLYALHYLNRFFQTKDRLSLIAGLFPIFNVVLFQFISSPSPDIPIYILTYLVFIEFARYAFIDTKKPTPIKLLFIFVVFAVYIKVLSIFLILFPLMLYAKRIDFLKKDILIISVISVISGLLFIVKNSIISGHPLYPLSYFILENKDWTMPVKLQQYLVDATKYYAYFVTPDTYVSMSFSDRLIRWLALPKLHGVFNKLMVALMVIAPFVYRKTKIKRPYIILIMVTTAQIVFLWLTSPQYRFFFGFLIVLSLFTIATFISQKQLVQAGLIVSTLAISIPLFIEFDLNKFTSNELKQRLSTFSIDYVLKPHPNSKYVNATYEKRKYGNLMFYTPKDIPFFWATGDCELPCVQQTQFEDFKNYFEQAPQLRTDNLKDGFKSVYFPYEQK